MQNVRLGPCNLLEYNSKHKVLICCECHYGIQKSAVQSHLLRHKIYREDRQSLLSYIAQLELAEPEDVISPDPDSPPIDTLPVIDGFRCTTDGCGQLCASAKRMKRHQSETHDLATPTELSLNVRQASLQTFFRGTRLRYFEVNCTSDKHSGRRPSQTPSSDGYDGIHPIPKQRRQICPTTKQITFVQPVLAPTPSVEASTISAQLVNPNVDLNVLTYFHHFTTKTYAYLPSGRRSRSAEDYWQRDVLFLALQRQWLMCGLLALSACHLVSLTSDEAVKRLHHQRQIDFGASFIAGCEAVSSTEEGLPTSLEREARDVSHRIICILRCADWSVTQRLHDVEAPLDATHGQILSQMLSVIECTAFEPVPECQIISEEESDDLKAASEHATRVLKMKLEAETDLGCSAAAHVPPSILNRLLELPAQLTEAMDGSYTIDDVLAILSSIAATIESCEISFANDTITSAWEGLVAWRARIPEHQRRLRRSGHPAALVVLAYAMAVLLQRVELCGCWFLKGVHKMVLLKIEEILRTGNTVLHDMVLELLA